MRNSKKIIAVVLAVLMAVSMMPITAISAFAADGVKLSECYANDNFIFIDEDTYLDEDVTTTKALVFSAYVQDATTLDLNGHTFTTSATPAVIVTNSDGAITATIKDSSMGTKKTTYNFSTDTVTNMPAGKIESTANVGAQVQNNTKLILNGGAIIGTASGIAPSNNGDNCDITINNGYVTGGSYAIPVAGTNCDVTVTGGVVYGNHMGIGFNGNYSGNSLTVSGGYVVGKTDAATAEAGSANAAIYFPGDDTLTISGGYVYGVNSPAIVVRSGEVSVTGGTITSTGDYDVKVASASSTVPTSAIVVDAAVNYPGGAPEVAVSGGKITSTDSDEALSFVGDEGDVATDCIEVTGGTYTANGVADTSVPVDTTAYVTDDFGTVFTASEIGTTYNCEYTNAQGKKTWKTFSTSIMSGDGTYKLLSDVSLTQRLTPGTFASNITFDLNGYTFTSTASDDAIRLGRTGSASSQKSFSIINTASDTAYINAKNGVDIYGKYNNLTIGENVVVNVTDSYAVYVHGTIKDTADAPTVQIDGTVNGDSAGIYAAGYSNYVINGTVTGDTGIYQKGGNVIVNDGAVVTGKGADVDPVQNGSGFTSTGEAITVEETTSHLYGSTVINGGTITSDNADAVGSYALEQATTAGKDAPDEIIPATSTAVFSSDVTDLAVLGYETTYDETAGGYVVNVDPTFNFAVNTTTGVGYATLEAAIAAAADGETVQLQSDAIGNGISIPVGKYPTGLTVDFNGYTYTIDGELVGSTGTKSQAFQLLKDNTITFKNGTIYSEKARMLVQNYSDLTLDNMTLTLNNTTTAPANVYTLSNNNGDVVIKDTTINANPVNNAFAFDVCRYSSYPSVNVTVTGDSVIDGNIEVSASKSDPKDGFSLTLESGTMTGDVVLDKTAVAVIDATPEKAEISKKATFDQDAPEGYVWETDTVTGDQTLVRETYVDPGCSFTLANGEIVNNVYLDGDYPADYTVVFTYNHNSDIAEEKDVRADAPVAVGTLTKTADGYKFPIKQAPAQFCDEISYTVYDPAGVAINSDTFTSKEVCEAGIITYASDTELVALFEAMLDYAKAAQDYFNYDAGSIDGYNDTDVQALDSIPSTGASSQVALTGISMVVTSDLGVNLYTDGAVTVTSVSGVAGVTAVAGKNEGKDVIRVRGIAPADLGKNITIVTDQGTIVISAYTAARSIVADPNASAALKDLARAVYLYGEAAADYFA